MKKISTFESDDIGVGCLTILITVLIAAIISLPFSMIAMWLWNSVLIDLFPVVPQIGFWQMYGLTILTHILFPSGSISRK